MEATMATAEATCSGCLVSLVTQTRRMRAFRSHAARRWR